MSGKVSYENGRLTIIRTFNAPREAVFNAWIETSKVELWWGCGIATKVRSEIEPRVGGKFAHLMTLKDIGDYEHVGFITEYEPPALLAYDLKDAFHDKTMRVRVKFSESEGVTTVRLTQDNLLDMYSQFVMAGWTGGLEKLAHVLAAEAVG